MNAQQRLEQKEISTLIGSGLASDRSQAMRMLKGQEALRKRSDLVIFFTPPDQPMVRDIFRGKLLDEKPYAGSMINMAMVPSGGMTNLIHQYYHKHAPNHSDLRPVLIGHLLELAPRDGKGDAKLTVWIKDETIVPGKKGLFFTPFSGTEARAHGSQLFSDQHNLERVEFQPIGGDCIFGIFAAWYDHSLRDQYALILAIPLSKVLWL